MLYCLGHYLKYVFGGCVGILLLRFLLGGVTMSNLVGPPPGPPVARRVEGERAGEESQDIYVV